MEWSQILILLAACLTVEGGNCDTALQKLNSQPTDAVTAYMYEHVNCEGEVLTVKKGDQISVMPDGWNDKVSSLVVREDCGLSVYVHRGMTGPMKVFFNKDQSLTSYSWPERYHICSGYFWEDCDFKEETNWHSWNDAISSYSASCNWRTC